MLRKSCSASDKGRVEPAETQALIRICQPRFRSFSGAVEHVLETLAEVVPGVLLLTQNLPDEGTCRVIGIHGEGIEGLRKGAILPLDPGFLESVGAESRLAVPLEMSDGRVVGTLAALEAGAGAYGAQHAVMVGMGARLLAYEWESVELRASLRRLRTQVAESPNVDSETGLAAREAFLELLDHDWRLAERGTAPSSLVVLRVEERSNGNGNGAAGRVALKIAADLLQSSVRATDRAGRVGERELAVTLVGCRPEQAPAFVERFRAALERAGRAGGPRVEVADGVQALAGAASAQEALALAESEVDGASRNGSAPSFEGAPR